MSNGHIARMVLKFSKLNILLVPLVLKQLLNYCLKYYTFLKGVGSQLYLIRWIHRVFEHVCIIHYRAAPMPAA